MREQSVPSPDPRMRPHCQVSLPISLKLLGLEGLGILVVWALQRCLGLRWPPQRQRRHALGWSGSLLCLLSFFLVARPVPRVAPEAGFYDWMYGRALPQTGHSYPLSLGGGSSFPVPGGRHPCYLMLLQRHTLFQVGLTLHRAGWNVLAGILACLIVVPLAYLWLV